MAKQSFSKYTALEPKCWSKRQFLVFKLSDKLRSEEALIIAGLKRQVCFLNRLCCQFITLGGKYCLEPGAKGLEWELVLCQLRQVISTVPQLPHLENRHKQVTVSLDWVSDGLRDVTFFFFPPPSWRPLLPYPKYDASPHSVHCMLSFDTLDITAKKLAIYSF